MPVGGGPAHASDGLCPFRCSGGQVLGRQGAEQVLATDVTGHEPIPFD
jgi:hypothetical protein